MLKFFHSSFFSAKHLTRKCLNFLFFFSQTSNSKMSGENDIVEQALVEDDGEKKSKSPKRRNDETSKTEKSEKSTKGTRSVN